MSALPSSDHARLRKIAILLAVVIAVMLFFSFGLHRYLTLDAVKAYRAELAETYQHRPLMTVAIFMLLHIAALALSLPGAVLTPSLAAGAIFGPLWGTVIALISIVIGDSLGFLGARYLFRDWVERRFGPQVEAIDRGVERDGIFYLLSLRLMAVVPFFVVNLSLGLTRMPLRIFAPVSLIGLIPATALYVNTGSSLAQIETPSDIFSPQLIGSFVLLALLPIAAKFLLGRRGDGDVPG